MPARPSNPSSSRWSWLADFDERLWPIHGIIGIFAALITVAALADTRFDDPRLATSAWLRVGVTVVVVLVLFVASLWLRSRAARRLLLCILVSLIAHAGFGVFAHHQYLTTSASMPEPVSKVAEEPAPEPPSPDFKFEYVETAPERSPFEDPVVVEAPPEAMSIEVARQALEKIAPPRDEPAPETPLPPAQPSPATVRPTDRDQPPPIDLASVTPITRHDLPRTSASDAPIPQPAIPENQPNAASHLTPAETPTTSPPPHSIAMARPQAESLPPETKTRQPDLASAVPRRKDPTSLPGVSPLLAAVMPRAAPPPDASSIDDTAQMPSLNPDLHSPSTGTFPGSLEPGVRTSVQRRAPELPAMSPGATRSPVRAAPDGAPLAMLPGHNRSEDRELPWPAVDNSNQGPSPIARSTAGPSASIAGEAVQLPQRSPAPAEIRDLPSNAQAAMVGKREANLPARAAGDPTTRDQGLPVASPALAGLTDSPLHRSPLRTETFSPTLSLELPRVGTKPSIEGRILELPAEPFRNRDPGTRSQAATAQGATRATEVAVERGLAYLARQQFPDGHWSLDRMPAAGEDPALGQMQSDSAATGLALLAFLGAGYTHQADKYEAVVERGLRWLIAHQKPDGDLFSGGSEYVWLYSHGIASIALCEALGMARDPGLREPARRAIRFIESSQHPTWGGWRYQPRAEADTSVSGWQLMAMKSAQMAGLEIPTRTVAKIGDWLDLAQAPGTAGGLYVYNPHASQAPEQASGRIPNRAMTAEGVLMRMYLGWHRQHPGIVEGARFIVEHPPEFGTPSRRLRDAYYWYYATQVMFHMQGDYWRRWRERLFPLLEESQVREGPFAGSWDPQRPIPDRWADAAGRHYVTAMSLLMLEVTYRHLPLFRDLGK